MTTFLHSLKQRKLVQWTLAYLAGGWLLLQVADLASANYHWPETVMHVLFALLPLGLVVTWLLAWYHGERGEQKVSGIELLLLAGVFAIGGFLIWRFALPHGSGARHVAVAPAPAASGTLPARSAPAMETTSVTAKSIAVLPFENLSPDKNNAYFADGMQDLILTKLADIGDLKVISRTSTQRYASRPDDLKTIGRQLGVATVLEGSVQKAGDQVLINVQLIDTRTDSHLWAESYQRKLENVFGVEGEVAGKIALALKAKLTATEQKQVAAQMTDNPAAYEAYLRGVVMQRSASGNFEDLEKAYARAVRLDPGFAMAWARLSEIRTRLYENFMDRSPGMLASARQAADTAVQLDPELGDGYLALAKYHYLGLRDMKGALPPLDKARELMPNNADVWATLGEVLERQNRWEEGNRAFLKAVDLDPRAVDRLLDLAQSYAALRDYGQSRQILSRAQVIAPDNPMLVAGKVYTYLMQGDLDKAGALLAKLPQASPLPVIILARINYETYRGRADAVARDVKKIVHSPGVPSMYLASFRVDYGLFLDSLGRKEQARIEARKGLGVLTTLRKSPADDHALAGSMADAYQILGNKQKALHWARRYVAANATCSICEAHAQGLLASIQARTGNPDAALTALPRLLKLPSGPTVGELLYAPQWSTLRKDPRFQALLREYPLPASAASTDPAEGDP